MNPPRSPKRIYLDSVKPEDFVDIQIHDWIEGVGDVSTRYEENFISSYGKLLVSRMTPALQPNQRRCKPCIPDDGNDCEICLAATERIHTSAPAPARYLPISLDFQPICIDKPCIGQIDICPVDDECDSVKQCVEHAQWLKENPDVAERNRKIITQHDAQVAKVGREQVLKELDAWASTHSFPVRKSQDGAHMVFVHQLKEQIEESLRQPEPQQEGRQR